MSIKYLSDNTDVYEATKAVAMNNLVKDITLNETNELYKQLLYKLKDSYVKKNFFLGTHDIDKVFDVVGTVNVDNFTFNIDRHPNTIKAKIINYIFGGSETVKLKESINDNGNICTCLKNSKGIKEQKKLVRNYCTEPIIHEDVLFCSNHILKLTVADMKLLPSELKDKIEENRKVIKEGINRGKNLSELEKVQSITTALKELYGINVKPKVRTSKSTRKPNHINTDMLDLYGSSKTMISSKVNKKKHKVNVIEESNAIDEMGSDGESTSDDSFEESSASTD